MMVRVGSSCSLVASKPQEKAALKKNMNSKDTLDYKRIGTMCHQVKITVNMISITKMKKIK